MDGELGEADRQRVARTQAEATSATEEVSNPERVAEEDSNFPYPAVDVFNAIIQGRVG